MNIKQIKDKEIFIIIGSPGTGKTTLMKDLEYSLKTNCIKYDDLDYSLVRVDHEIAYSKITCDIGSLRHTDNKIIITSNVYPNKLTRLLVDPDLIYKTVYLYTSFNMDLYLASPLFFMGSMVKKFKTALVKSFNKTLKTQPCYIITKNNQYITRFKKGVN